MDSIFSLGRFRFKLLSSDSLLLESIGSVFLLDNGLEKSAMQIIDLDRPFDIVPNWSSLVPAPTEFELIRLIVRLALDRHRDCFWMDAATVVSPDGHVVLIAGPSHSGKSTAAMALSFGLNWKVISEDITLLDVSSLSLIPFASPLSAREGTLERIHRATGAQLGRLIGGEWLNLGCHADGSSHSKIDFAYILPKTDGTVDEQFGVKQISLADFVRHLVPISNILHLPSGLESVMDLLSSARCFGIEGGNLNERLDCIVTACQSQLAKK